MTKYNELDNEIDKAEQNSKAKKTALRKLIRYTENKIKPFTLNKSGKGYMENYFYEFKYSDIINAIDISASKYLIYNSDDEPTSDSVKNFISKIGGILNLQNRSPVDKKIAYIKGICRNTFYYWNNKDGSAVINNYVKALRNYGWSEERILKDLELEVIPATKQKKNWSSWVLLVEEWTDTIYSWIKAEEQESRKLESYEKSELLNYNTYLFEKQKGGASSYQSYKPLKKKVEELCKKEISGCKSALQLCEVVSYVVETEYPNLLEEFEPYQKHSENGGGWTKPTFYRWCNNIYKKLIPKI